MNFINKFSNFICFVTFSIARIPSEHFDFQLETNRKLSKNGCFICSFPVFTMYTIPQQLQYLHSLRCYILWKNVFNENFWWCYFSYNCSLCVNAHRIILSYILTHTYTKYIGSILGWNFPVCFYDVHIGYIGSCLRYFIRVSTNTDIKYRTREKWITEEWINSRMWNTFYGLLWDDEWFTHTGVRDNCEMHLLTKTMNDFLTESNTFQYLPMQGIVKCIYTVRLLNFIVVF